MSVDMKKQLLFLPLCLLLASPLQAADYDAEGQPGETIFNNRCADVCHQTPALGRLNPKQWRRVLTTMQKRMAGVGMDPLTDEEFQQVLDYVSQGR